MKSLLACVLVAGLSIPPAVSAQAHIVAPSELQSAVLAATQAREKNQKRIAAFLSTAKAEKAMKTARVDAKMVRNAVSSLSDEELARLAARAEKAQDDFAAGRLTERDLLLILVGLAALILIIVAVD